MGTSSLLQLRLYVATGAPNSSSALAQLRAYLRAHGDVVADLEIIDVLESSERALRDGVFVTPMLVVSQDGRERRVIGNLKDPAVLETAIPSKRFE